MKWKVVGLLTSFFALAGGAFGQARFDPQSIIVNPTTTDLKVQVDLNRAGENPVYAVGERISINVTVNQDAYVYLFDVNSNGEIVQILPNRFTGGSEFMRAGERRTFPPAGANFEFKIDLPAGQSKVLAVASRQQLDLSNIARFQSNQPLAQTLPQVRGQENLARALSIAVQPVPQQDWVTDIAYYQVRGGGTIPTPPITTGSIALQGVPVGAQIFLDNQLVGRGSVTIPTTAGRKTVRVSLDGFVDFIATVTVVAGRTTVVPVTLNPIPRQGTLSLRVNVANALVFIDGQQAGRTDGSGSLSIPNLSLGNHEVVVLSPGYRAFVSNFGINGGGVTSIDVRLTRLF